MSAEAPSPPPASPAVTPRRRPWFRVPILAIVLIVASLAIAFTALRTASQAWHEVTYTFTVLALLTAMLASRFRRGSERAFWYGFAVFGWAFFLLGYRPWMNAFNEVDDEGLGSPFNPFLLTSRLFEYLLPRVRLTTNDGAMIDEITSTTLAVLHLLMTLAVAFVGGIVALLMRRYPRGRPSAKVLTILVGLALAGTAALASEAPTSIVDLRWRRTSLAAMGESRDLSLASKDPDAVAYRMIWDPTFHNPVGVRIERADGIVRLRAVILSGKGGYEWGFIAIERSRELTAEQWDRLEGLVKQAAFWASSTWSKENEDGLMDGDFLTFEGAKRGAHHRITVRLPIPASEALCREMLDLTGIDLGKVWEEYHPSRSKDGRE